MFGEFIVVSAQADAGMVGGCEIWINSKLVISLQNGAA